MPDDLEKKKTQSDVAVTEAYRSGIIQGLNRVKAHVRNKPNHVIMLSRELLMEWLDEELGKLD